jgi:hypothetical protein
VGGNPAGAALVARPAGCNDKQYREFRTWYAQLLKESRKSAKEAEDLFYAQMEDTADTAPREHINPQRDWTGIKESLHRAVWVLLSVRVFSGDEIARLLHIHPKSLSRIKRILKEQNF